MSFLVVDRSLDLRPAHGRGESRIVEASVASSSRQSSGGKLYITASAWIYRSRPVLSNNRIMQEAITRDPEVMHGTPVFRGTRVPVQTLFDYIENGESLDEFLEGFPTISRQHAVQVLEECKELRLARV